MATYQPELVNRVLSGVPDSIESSVKIGKDIYLFKDLWAWKFNEAMDRVDGSPQIKYDIWPPCYRYSSSDINKNKVQTTPAFDFGKLSSSSSSKYDKHHGHHHHHRHQHHRDHKNKHDRDYDPYYNK